MTAPRASVVLRALAEQALRPYRGPAPPGIGTDTWRIARTCASFYAGALDAVATEFERCEVEDGEAQDKYVRMIGEASARIEAKAASLATWAPRPEEMR